MEGDDPILDGTNREVVRTYISVRTLGQLHHNSNNLIVRRLITSTRLIIGN